MDSMPPAFPSYIKNPKAEAEENARGKNELLTSKIFCSSCWARCRSSGGAHGAPRGNCKCHGSTPQRAPWSSSRQFTLESLPQSPHHTCYGRKRPRGGGHACQRGVRDGAAILLTMTYRSSISLPLPPVILLFHCARASSLKQEGAGMKIKLGFLGRPAQS
jgi:hypothetical protein